MTSTVYNYHLISHTIKINKPLYAAHLSNINQNKTGYNKTGINSLTSIFFLV